MRVFVDFVIDRRALYQFCIYAKLLDNSIFFWWWTVNETFARYNRPLWPRVQSLKDITKLTLLKYAPTDEFIHPTVLDLYPPAIQEFLRTWVGEYKVTREGELSTDLAFST